MRQTLVTQFEWVRGRIQQFIEVTPESLVDQMPNGFNNTIRWNIGHILVIAERLFGTNRLPSHYLTLFGNGTKPADWTEEIPTLEELSSLLQEQTCYIIETFTDHLEDPLPKSFLLGPEKLRIEAVKDVFTFNNMHEAVHLGYLLALKRAITTQTE